jgi:hypothetical protein
LVISWCRKIPASKPLKRKAFSQPGNRPQPSTEPIPSFPARQVRLFQNQPQETPMIWLLLLLIVMAAICVNSARLFLLGLLIMAVKAFPRTVLTSIGAVIAWAIKTNFKR